MQKALSENKFQFVVVLILLSSLISWTDRKPLSSSEYNSINFPDSNLVPFYEQIIVYTKPAFDSKPLLKTKHYNNSFRLLELLEFPKTNFHGVLGRWCKVSFLLGGKRFTGYIPTQSLANCYTKESGKTYMVGLYAYQPKPLFKYQAALKITQNGALLKEILFEPVSQYSTNENDEKQGEYACYTQINVFDSLGLKQIDRIIEVNTGVDACGYEGGSNYFLLKNNKLISHLKSNAVADGGEFYSGLEYKFPNDSLGAKDTLIVNYTLSESINDSQAMEE
ncbi:MAG: hypothetical protein ACOVP1_05005, partial [Bacteroidia bacterium]